MFKLKTNETQRIFELLPKRYTLGKKIGSGATGAVYEGYDDFKKQVVAIKVAHASVFDQDETSIKSRKAWLNEVQLAGSLQHPYIVTVFDAGAGDSFAYIVMECLDGGTLKQFVSVEQRLALEETMEIIFKCATALEFAHHHGVIHRDIKPSNIQYLSSGAVKIGDFGSAFAAKREATQVLDVGTIAYTAPEIFQNIILPQADIYSLGVVLYELLTGQRMLQGDSNASLLYQAIYGERPDVGEVRPDLPEKVRVLVNRMIAPKLENRFSNWSEVLEILERVSFNLNSETHENTRDSDQFRLLRRTSVLSEFDDAELWSLLGVSKWKEVQKGQVVCREGAIANSLYLLAKGQAKIMQNGKVIGWMQEGSIFGEVAFAELAASTRSATVVAESTATIVKWSMPKLLKAWDNVQLKLYRMLFRLAVEKLRNADERYLTLYNQLKSRTPK